MPGDTSTPMEDEKFVFPDVERDDIEEITCEEEERDVEMEVKEVPLQPESTQPSRPPRTRTLTGVKVFRVDNQALLGLLPEIPYRENLFPV